MFHKLSLCFRFETTIYIIIFFLIFDYKIPDSIYVYAGSTRFTKGISTYIRHLEYHKNPVVRDNNWLCAVNNNCYSCKH